MAPLKKRVLVPVGIVLILIVLLAIVCYTLFLTGVYSFREAQEIKEQCYTPDKRIGQCIPAEECKQSAEVVTSHQEAAGKKLHEYICDYKKNITYICCLPDLINTHNETDEVSTILPPANTTEHMDVLRSAENSTSSSVPPRRKRPRKLLTVTTTPAPPNVTDHSNLHLLPEECGINTDTEDRIRNGKNAGLLEFPWMAALAYSTSKGPKFMCGGTIINDRYILTAAHCLTEELPASVRVGEYDTSSETDCEKMKCLPPVQDLTIEKVVPHEQYDRSSYENDIGLIRVSKINLEVDNAKTICLPVTEETKEKELRFADVTGWGFTSPNGTTSTGVLQKVSLPVRNLTDCKNAYRASPHLSFSYKQMCVGDSDNKDSCKGDSGGPLQAKGYFKDEFRYVQYGIVSFGHTFCGTDGSPGVYTNVAYYMNWILDKIKP